MLKALFKKQLMEYLSGQLTVNQKKQNAKMKATAKNGKPKQRSLKGVIGIWVFLSVLMWVCFGALAVGEAVILFTDIGEEVIPVANPDGTFFSTFVLIGIVFGLFGSALTTYTALYKAKDNDFLLSMPIPPKYILLTRISVVFVISLIYVSWGVLPAMVTYWAFGRATLFQPLASILMLLLLTTVVTALSSFIAAGIAFVASHVRNTTLLKVLAAVVFIGLYMVFYMNVMVSGKMDEKITDFSKVIADVPVISNIAAAFAGDGLNLLLCLGVTAVVFGLMFWFLSAKFVDFTTNEKQMKKAEYSASQVRTASSDKALVRREFHRIFGNANIILNCFMPGFLTLIGVVLLLVNAGTLRASLAELTLTEDGNSFPVFAAIFTPMLCMLGGMNTYSAAAVSLEGKSIWHIKTMPVKPDDILKAKLVCHLLLSIPPILLLSVVGAIVLQIHPLVWAVGTLTGIAFTVAMGEFGLVLNLKYPILDWTNEMIPVKSSKPVMIVLLPMVIAMPFIIGLIIGLAVFFGTQGFGILGIVIGAVVFLAITLFFVFYLRHWIKIHGAAKWNAL